MKNFLFFSALLLVTSGAPLNEQTQKTEIIDLIHPDHQCPALADFPVQIENSVGGLLKNSVAVICGGIIKVGPADFQPQSTCYMFSNNGVSIKFFVKSNFLIFREIKCLKNLK